MLRLANHLRQVHSSIGEEKRHHLLEVAKKHQPLKSMEVLADQAKTWQRWKMEDFVMREVVVV